MLLGRYYSSCPGINFLTLGWERVNPKVLRNPRAECSGICLLSHTWLGASESQGPEEPPCGVLRRDHARRLCGGAERDAGAARRREGSGGGGGRNVKERPGETAALRAALTSVVGLRV
jgi:hypothetical protein